MSCYSGVRLIGVIKKECREFISKVFSYDENTVPEDVWNNSGIERVQNFYNGYPRSSNNIPYCTCAPSSYWSLDLEENEKFKRKFNKETGEIAFIASSNHAYCMIIEFIETVIPVICEKVEYCEFKDEEDDISKVYVLSQEGLIIDDNDVISYSEDGLPTMVNDPSLGIDYLKRFEDELYSRKG